MAQSIEEAHDALRERQGEGARYDAVEAPGTDLALARLGSAYFFRKLNELTDAELDRPSLVPGWSRRHLIADIGYQARRLARLVEAARSLRREESLDEPDAQNEDVDFGASLPAHALRYLYRHSQVHLDVEWRDLDAAGWLFTVRSLRGDMVPVAETPRLRSRAIWLAAVDLDNGGSFRDFPNSVTDSLLEDVAVNLHRGPAIPSVRLLRSDRSDAVIVGSGECVVSGTSSDLLRWLSGRGARRISGDKAGFEPTFWR
ncbi:maleylpyruvate isomerase family mycothiol-dependent enzyme [Agrobacterium rosae]|uniref:Mycothiol-dependent maleylpyruvate isomerase n=1 Tax=Agrobacterium rosae TaxID=1972867 RepID=A0A1R3U777_9HYPH|nr:maleylpyruvate isomerase family mycothiol-dependent enzyme [Agrobacterium rosae]SCX35277.1 mycothiol-dependent maleylpyruvate isomerase [Agrobacterium rosae]